MPDERAEGDGARRLFVALPLPAELAHRTAQAVRDVLGGERGLRLVPPEELHLTLYFLGAVGADRLSRLESALASALEGTRAPRIVFGATGCFPLRGRPRVWWVGLADEGGRLALLQRAVTEGVERAELLAPSGADDARAGSTAWSPHLTVARTRRSAHVPARAVEAEFRALELHERWEPPAAMLFESCLERREDRYVIRRCFALWPCDSAGRDGPEGAAE